MSNLETAGVYGLLVGVLVMMCVLGFLLGQTADKVDALAASIDALCVKVSCIEGSK